VATLRAAAREALAVGAPEMAAACLRRALEQPPPAAAQVDVLFELGRAEGVLTDPAGVGRVRHALAACGDPVRRGQITLDLAGQLLVRGAVGEAVAACDAAALDLPEDERELRFELFAHEPLRRAELLTRERPLRLERARVLVELGAGLSRRGKRSEAMPFLREGLDLADRCGAGPIAAHAREQLRAAGARPRRARVSGRDALTPSELRVCRMASTGMSNREIAQALFVSLRTVETHLTRSYAKLEVGGREQLREVLDGVSGDSVFALSDVRPAG
jgi:DNA-binding CsgD family transcriptional regulator